MQQIHLLLYAILLGLGAAMPIGPINLEIIRRNLQFGTTAGMMVGFGASCTDLCYVILLSIGALTLLNHPEVISVMSILGAFVLAWFGWGALRLTTADRGNTTLCRTISNSFFKHWRDGYLMNALNPMIMLFWLSVSSQVAGLSSHHNQNMFIMVAGVIIGAFGWAISLNTVLHFTRHRISNAIMHRLNQLGGMLLLGFAAYGLWHGIHMLLTTVSK